MILRIRVTPPVACAAIAAVERAFKSYGAVRLSRTMRRGAQTLAAAASLAVCANSTANLPASMLKPAPDPRIARLEQFFHLYHCPAPQHVTEYLQAADGYGLDYRLLPAVSVRETQCGVQQKQNNRWGYHPGRQSFPTVAAGIDYVARQLAENPAYKGKNLRDKLFTYNPRPAYPVEVQRIMRQIE